MIEHDNKLIKEIISTDLKKISNPDFTLTTLQKIKESKKTISTKYAKQTDFTLLYPVFAFSILFVLYSIANMINLWIEITNLEIILILKGIISELLFNPIMVSSMIVFTLLYLFDTYLKKHDTKLSHSLASL